jgi:hypothetical protein
VSSLIKKTLKKILGILPRIGKLNNIKENMIRILNIKNFLKKNFSCFMNLKKIAK